MMKRERAARAHGDVQHQGGLLGSGDGVGRGSVAHPAHPPARRGDGGDAVGGGQADQALPRGPQGVGGSGAVVVAGEGGAGPDPGAAGLGDGHLHPPQGHQLAQTVLPVQEGHRRPLPYHAGSCEGIAAPGAEAGDVAREDAQTVRLDPPRLGLHQHLGYLLRRGEGTPAPCRASVARAVQSSSERRGPSSIRGCYQPSCVRRTAHRRPCAGDPGDPTWRYHRPVSGDDRRRGGHHPAPGGAGLSQAPAALPAGGRPGGVPGPAVGPRPPAGPPGRAPARRLPAPPPGVGRPRGASGADPPRMGRGGAGIPARPPGGDPGPGGVRAPRGLVPGHRRAHHRRPGDDRGGDGALRRRSRRGGAGGASGRGVARAGPARPAPGHPGAAQRAPERPAGRWVSPLGCPPCWPATTSSSAPTRPCRPPRPPRCFR